jgi:hypothetical protein
MAFSRKPMKFNDLFKIIDSIRKNHDSWDCKEQLSEQMEVILHLSSMMDEHLCNVTRCPYKHRMCWKLQGEMRRILECLLRKYNDIRARDNKRKLRFKVKFELDECHKDEFEKRGIKFIDRQHFRAEEYKFAVIKGLRSPFDRSSILRRTAVLRSFMKSQGEEPKTIKIADEVPDFCMLIPNCRVDVHKLWSKFLMMGNKQH